MKFKLILIVAVLFGACATADNNKFNRQEVLSDFDRAWDDYWSKNEKRNWPRGEACKNIRKVRSDCPPKPSPLRNFGKIDR